MRTLLVSIVLVAALHARSEAAPAAAEVASFPLAGDSARAGAASSGTSEHEPLFDLAALTLAGLAALQFLASHLRRGPTAMPRDSVGA